MKMPSNYSSSKHCDGVAFVFQRSWRRPCEAVQNMCALFAIVLVSAVFLGCDSREAWPPSGAALKKIQTDYDAALADATNAIPYARDFARLFPGTESFFSYYIGGAGASCFNMEVLLFDRYQLVMKLPVTFDTSRRKIKTFGEPEFQLLEVASVKKNHKVGVWPDGSPAVSDQLSLSFNAGRNFGAGEWGKVVETGGDFSVIGFPLGTNSPAPGFEDFRNDWEMKWKKRR